MSGLLSAPENNAQHFGVREKMPRNSEKINCRRTVLEQALINLEFKLL